MSADFMTVRLHLPGVRVTGVVVDTPTELVVGVVSVKKLSKCPHCGCSCRRVHDRRQREIRDLSTVVAGRCCCGPSGGWCATIAGNGTSRPILSSRGA